MAKWKDRLRRLEKKGPPKIGACVVCAKPVLGCHADDSCPATLLCPVHYSAQGIACGDGEFFGLAADESLRRLDPFYVEVEKAVKDWPSWQGLFEEVMKKRGLVHG